MWDFLLVLGMIFVAVICVAILSAILVVLLSTDGCFLRIVTIMFIVIIIAVGFIGASAIINTISIKLRTESQEYIEVATIVSSLKYQEPYTTHSAVHNGKNAIAIKNNHPAKYLVTITYQTLSITYDNESLFNSVKQGDSINMTLCNSYDKNHNLINQQLSLPE